MNVEHAYKRASKKTLILIIPPFMIIFFSCLFCVTGMLDLDAPCNSVELHVFALQLDKDNNGRIDYLEFAKGLTFPDR